MTLADAIRKGSMQRPQGFYGPFRDNGTTSCALGAAYEGVFGERADDDEVYHAMGQEFGIYRRTHSCPAPLASGCRSMGEQCEADIITHLNDAHRWTRERIADWVDTL